MSIDSTTPLNLRNVKEDIQLTDEENVFVSELMALTANGLTMKRGVVTLRSFSLQGYGSALIALMLHESADGYIVGLPAQLASREDGSVEASFVTATPLVKLQKHAVAIYSLPTQQAFFHYLKSVSGNYSMLPGYFTEERKLQIASLIAQMAPTYDKPVNPKETNGSNGVESDKNIAPIHKLPPEERAKVMKEAKQVKNPILPSDDSYYIENKTNKYLH